MKDCFSTLPFSRKTPYGQSSRLGTGILLFSVLVYFGGCPAFAASMQETVSDCAEIVQDFSRIAERSIPPLAVQSAKGIAILRVLKGGFFVSGRIGEGLVIARLPDGGWSGPSAIGTGGAVTLPEGQRSYSSEYAGRLSANCPGARACGCRAMP